MKNTISATIASNLSRKKPTDRALFIKVIRESLRNVRLKSLDSHNTTSIIFIIYDNDNPILLKAEFGQNTATHKEITWYEYHAATRKDRQGLFVEGVRSQNFALLYLRYIEGVLTIDEWTQETSAKGNSIGKLLMEALDYDRSMFVDTSGKVRQSDIEGFLFEKYKARRAKSKCTAYLNDLLSSHYVVINGKRSLTPDFAIAKLANNPKIMKYLLPTKMGFVHGDLHTGNILTKAGELYYIDPNGNLRMPIEYDIGKLLHSVNGQYPMIMQDKFLLKKDQEGGYEFTVYENTAYQEACNYLRSRLTQEEFLRGLYFEALHFATMLPHHAAERRETIALYLRTVELFDELLYLL